MTTHHTGAGEVSITKMFALDSLLDIFLNGGHSPSETDTHFIDTHAGTGYSEEFNIPIEGSTLRSLTHGFNEYTFIEKDPDRYALLCNTIQNTVNSKLRHHSSTKTSGTYNGKQVSILNTDSSEFIEHIMDNSNSDYYFVFSDASLTIYHSLFNAVSTVNNADHLYNFQTTGLLQGLSTDYSDVNSPHTRCIPTCINNEDELIDWFHETYIEPTGRDSLFITIELTLTETIGHRYELIYTTLNNDVTAIKNEFDARQQILSQTRTLLEESADEIGELHPNEEQRLEATLSNDDYMTINTTCR